MGEIFFKAFMPNHSPHPKNKVGCVYPEFFPSFKIIYGGEGEKELPGIFQKVALFYKGT